LGLDGIDHHWLESLTLSLECQLCLGLQRIAIEASRAYYELLSNLEVMHIRHDSEATLTLSWHLARALKYRDTAIKELTNHESTHAEKALTAF